MIVLIGPHGQHYHRQTCSNVTDNMTEVEQDVAEECAYGKCGTCFGNDKTPHCPACHRASVSTRHGGMSRPKAGHVWVCDNCGNEFDDPQLLRGNGSVRSDTLAGKLDDMDPETEIVNPEEVEQ